MKTYSILFRDQYDIIIAKLTIKALDELTVFKKAELIKKDVYTQVKRVDITELYFS